MCALKETTGMVGERQDWEKARASEDTSRVIIERTVRISAEAVTVRTEEGGI